MVRTINRKVFWLKGATYKTFGLRLRCVMHACTFVHGFEGRRGKKMHSGHVPSFKIRPNYGALIGAVIVLLFGVLGFYHFRSNPGDLDAEGRGSLLLAVCIVISGGLTIIATSRMWFRHLWHQRYK